MMDEEQLYRIYEAHIKNGASEDDAWRAVELAKGGGETSPELEAQKRLSADGGSATGDFARMAAQGATFGFADELLGDKSRVADLRQLAPGASMMSEIAGGVALPVAAGGQSVRAGGGFLRAAGAGALGGAVQGGLTGLGEGEGSVEERLPSAGKGAAIGAGAGALLGTLPFALNPAYQRLVKGKLPLRITDLLQKASGTEGLYAASTKAAAGKSAAGAELGALDAANPAIADSRVLAALSQDRFANKAVRAVEPGGFSGAKPPSLENVRTVLQELKDAEARAAKKPRTTLARGYREARRDIKGATGDVVPGFKEGMQGYAKAASLEEGLGTKGLAGKSADELRLAFEGKFPEMQEGMRTRLVHDISKQASAGGEWLSGMVHRDPEKIARLRMLFPDDDAGSKAFSKLVDELALEQSASKARTGALRTLKASPYLAGAGALGYGLRQMLGGSSGRP